MGEDVEGEVGEAQAGYVGDAEDDTDLEGGECLACERPFLGGADVFFGQRGHGRGWKKFPK